VNSSQTVAASYRYDPFGNLVSSSGSLASANVYRFSSKELHVNSGMYYYGYRFYEPNLQRWINRDLLSDAAFHLTAGHAWLFRAVVEFLGGPNLYDFARQNPVSYYDPLGLLTFPFRRECSPTERAACELTCAQYGVKECFVWEFYDEKGNKTGESVQCICNPPPDRRKNPKPRTPVYQCH
jgi:RHS repeat-associated protein